MLLQHRRCQPEVEGMPAPEVAATEGPALQPRRSFPPSNFTINSWGSPTELEVADRNGGGSRVCLLGDAVGYGRENCRAFLFSITAVHVSSASGGRTASATRWRRRGTSQTTGEGPAVCSASGRTAGEQPRAEGQICCRCYCCCWRYKVWTVDCGINASPFGRDLERRWAVYLAPGKTEATGWQRRSTYEWEGTRRSFSFPLYWCLETERKARLTTVRNSEHNLHRLTYQTTFSYVALRSLSLGHNKLRHHSASSASRHSFCG